MPSDPPLVLIVEDEAKIRRFLRASLAAHEMRVAEAETGEEALRAARTAPPDVVVLDLGLPDLDGVEVIRRLREWTPVPIVVLSARGQEHDKIAALDAGADDYVAKPFGVGELLARLRAALRRNALAASGASEPICVGGLEIDLAGRRVALAGKEVRLTPTEYRLLAVLAQHTGKIVGHKQLLREVWGPPFENETHYLRVYAAQIRRKIEKDPARPRYLLIEPGVGYRLAGE